MWLKKTGFKSSVRKAIISLAILVFLFSFLSIVNPGLAVAGGANPGLPDHLILSWTEDPLTTQTISWRTGTDTTQERVQYLPAAEFNGSFDGANEVIGEKNDLYDGHFCFEATLRGLVPGTDYVYRVGREGAWSEPANFTTAPEGRDQFFFLYMGDVQDGYEFWGEMLEGVIAENPDLKFALIGGDLVDQGNSIEEWQQFFAAAWPVFQELPLMPAVGNHDDTELFRNSFAVPRNGPAGYEDTIYSFDYGNCHITVLNSNHMGPGLGDYDKITGWLQNDLDSSDQRWKFLVFHHPPYPVVHDWRADVLQEHWVPLFEECQVDMVFVGHQHVYMRTKPMRNGQIQPDGEGIVYVMGNAGTKYYGPGPDYDYIACQLAWTSNYQVIEIDGDTLTMTAKDTDGEVFDSYTLTKESPDEKAVYAVTPVEEPIYQIDVTPDGINTMTVNDDVSGIKYFSVQITPVIAHDGLEAVVFALYRNGIQHSLNVTKADFDEVEMAQAGFNVKPDDMVKVYMVDHLNNAVDCNPTILQ